MPIALPPPHLLELSGPDAIAFAHAQFASDLRALAVGHWQWSAWLSAQGRVRALFRLLRVADDRLLAVIEGASSETMREGLARYVLRSKVQLLADRAAAAAGYFDAAQLPASIRPGPTGDAFAQAQDVIAIAIAHEGPWRWLVFGDAGTLGPLDTAANGVDRWRAADIEAGIVALNDEQAERYLPAWLGLDGLGAVSVGKGCYPGQEIVARLHFRGGNKRWLHRLAFQAPELPAPGSALLTGPGLTDGELVAAAWTRPPEGVALAVLPQLPPGSELRAPTVPGSFRVVSPVHAAST